MKNLPPELKFHPKAILATWFFSGLSPVAPGTVGTFVAIPFAILMLNFLSIAQFEIIILITFILGVICANWVEDKTNSHDLGLIVIDEVVGVWVGVIPLALIPQALELTATGVCYWLGAFALFRFFDITKILGIGWLDKNINAGMGVMLDDVLAGIYTAFTLWLFHTYLLQPYIISPTVVTI